MDPDATLAAIDDELHNPSSPYQLRAHVNDLRDWVRRGGFAPNWKQYPAAEAYYYVVIEHANLHRVTTNYFNRVDAHLGQDFDDVSTPLKHMLAQQRESVDY